jgi:hypothetical protein
VTRHSGPFARAVVLTKEQRTTKDAKDTPSLPSTPNPSRNLPPSREKLREKVSAIRSSRFCTAPYDPAELKAPADEHGIRRLIVKRRLQLDERPMPEQDAAGALLQNRFRIPARLALLRHLPAPLTAPTSTPTRWTLRIHAATL